MDSPRGRIWLMQATLDGTVELNRTVAEHFDRCLGCMACLTSCPSGVQVRPADRADARAGRAGGAAAAVASALLRRLVFAVFPHPRGLRVALPFARLPAPGPFKPLRDLRAAVARAGLAAGRDARRRRARRARRPAARAASRASSSAR